MLLVPMGAASISFVATNNATLQLRADPAMRGRVMSLNAIAFLGSTPIGAPLLGLHQRHHQPARCALVIGGVATLLASIPLFVLAPASAATAPRASSWASRVLRRRTSCADRSRTPGTKTGCAEPAEPSFRPGERASGRPGTSPRRTR